MTDVIPGPIGSARRFVVVAILPVLAACSANEPHPGGGGSETPSWPAERELRIGSLDDPEYALTEVRDMEIGPDGSIYTLHFTEALIRQFDSAGRFVRTIGRRGDGPGEFQRPRAMGTVADTLWVMDGNGYRVSEFDLGGVFLRSFTVPFEPGAPLDGVSPMPEGVLFDGTVYGEPLRIPDRLADGSISEARPVLMTRGGDVTLTLPGIPYSNLEWFIAVGTRGGGASRMQPYSDSPLHAFSHTERALLVVDREAPSSIHEASYDVIKLAFGGDTLFTHTFDFEPTPLDEAVLDSLTDWLAEFASETWQGAISVAEARRLAEDGLYRPAFRPGVLHLVPGRDGSIAIGLEPGDADTATWLFLDSDGAPMGEVDLPANVLIHQVDLPLLWGVETDAFDVPYVVRYRVETSMIGVRDDTTGATLASRGHVTGPRSQPSRGRRGGSSHERAEAG